MLSVLITIYREPWMWVKQSLDSLWQQTLNDFELILVVDNPTYSDIEKLSKYVKKHFKKNKIIVNKKNLGLVKSLNKAFLNSTGQYIARMDSDDISKKNRFEVELRFLKDKKLDFISSNITLIDENTEEIESKALLNKVNNHDIFEIEKWQNCFWHPTWLMKREVMQALNGYREIPAAEDYDFVVRSLMSGFQLGFCSECLLMKRVNDTSISEVNNYYQVVVANKIGKAFRMGKMLQLDDLPQINEQEKKRFGIVKENFGQRKQHGVDFYTKLLLKLLFWREGRLLLKLFLIQKYQVKILNLKNKW